MDNEETQPESITPGSNEERLTNRVLKPGDGFGDFRVVKCLSSSLLANYYHMQHVRDLHDVAACIFHPRTIDDPTCLKRLEDLQTALQTIDHEGVPKIHECAVISNRHCMFMDAVPGQSLSHYFAQHATPGEVGLDVADTMRIVALLSGVLGYAHAQGVDHRDLDTDLIFIQDDGSIKMLGLGVKAALGGDLFESVVSASVCPLVPNDAPARLNSFDVMSPEYRRGIDEDQRVDIFATGYIAYWLLTGTKANLSDYQAPSSLISELPQVWDTLIETSLQRNRDDRYQSFKSLLIALKNTEKGIESAGAGLAQRQIDRIPVPKGIVDRGELATRIYRLAVIGLIGLTLTGLAAAYLNSMFKDEEGPQVTISMAAEGAPANVRFSLLPAEAKVRFVGIDGVFRSKTGELGLVVPQGEYDVRITAPDCMEETMSLTVTNVDLPKVSVVLEPAWKEFEIQTVPGATIVLQDEADLEQELGVADADGRFHLKQQVHDGAFRIIVRKVGYTPRVLEDLSGELVEAALVALPSSVTVRTQPEGARVFINDVDVGLSPVTIDATEESGNYVVAVSYEGYRSEGQSFHLDLGAHKVVDFGALVARSAELGFEVTFANAAELEIPKLMSDLEVEFDGQRLQYGSELFKTVSEGEHTVRLLHPYYVTEPQMITMADGVDQTLTYAMSPLPAQVELVLPAGLVADIRVNQAEVTMLDGTIAVAANQLAEVELRIKDYLTMVRRYELKPNERAVWNVAPVKIPGPEPGAEWTLPYLALKLSWIAAGQFTMGSPRQETGRLPNEGPQVSVRFSRGFWAGTYEVTQAQYHKVMGGNSSNARLPVDSVAWEDAKLYCRMITDQERAAGRLPDGYVYRLPTEAEWEYLARSGSDSSFAFGNRADPSDGNFRGIYPVSGESVANAPDHYGSLPVGSYSPNAYGLHDTHGNVAEWTLDRYNGRLPGGTSVDPRPREEGRRVTVRGGSWEDFAVRVRCAARDEVRADTTSDAIGFRVVLAPAF